MFKIHYFRKLTSTNEKAKEFDVGHVVIADSQTKGKGRFRRKWFSGEGGIYMSLTVKATKLKYLTFIAAISVYEAINIPGIKVKWPNDLIYEKRKLCGILTEIIKDKAIIGIGVNVNNKLPRYLKNKAITLKQLGKDIDKRLLINRILKRFEFWYNKDKDAVIKRWKEISFLGAKVKVVTRKESYEGVAIDIEDYKLVLRTKQGIKKIIEGDVFIL